MIEEIQARPWHVGQLARTLRDGHRNLLSAMDVPTHRELRDAFASSIMVRAWMIDGKLGALAGLNATMASPEGTLWLALSQEATAHPVAIARRALRVVGEMVKNRHRLTTIVLEDDKVGLDFVRWLGFFTDSHMTINGARVHLMSYSIRKAA